MKNSIIFLFLLAGLAYLFHGCTGSSGGPVDPPVIVRVEKVHPSDIGEDLAYSGTIEESETVPLSFSSVGTVANVYVQEGTLVRKGQLLATLDSTTYRNTFVMMKAAEQQAEDAYRRMTPMHKNGNLPEVKYVEVETGLQKAKASAAIARKNLDDCSLYATTDGFIGRRSIEPGLTAMPNLTSITIVKIDKVFARVSVAENEISLIRKGQKAIVTIGALGSGRYDGSVEEIGVVADPVTHSYRIRIGILNRDYSIRPGMICSACIRKEGVTGGLVVPDRAVLVDEAGKNFVYTVSPNNTAVRTYLGIGRLMNSGIEVLNGLHADDIVVVSGQHKLVDNAAVRIAD